MHNFQQLQKKTNKFVILKGGHLRPNKKESRFKILFTRSTILKSSGADRSAGYRIFQIFTRVSNEIRHGSYENARVSGSLNLRKIPAIFAYIPREGVGSRSIQSEKHESPEILFRCWVTIPRLSTWKGGLCPLGDALTHLQRLRYWGWSSYGSLSLFDPPRCFWKVEQLWWNRKTQQCASLSWLIHNYVYFLLDQVFWSYDVTKVHEI